MLYIIKLFIKLSFHTMPCENENLWQICVPGKCWACQRLSKKFQFHHAIASNFFSLHCKSAFMLDRRIFFIWEQGKFEIVSILTCQHSSGTTFNELVDQDIYVLIKSFQIITSTVAWSMLGVLFKCWFLLHEKTQDQVLSCFFNWGHKN